jgi:hypothetical protein
VACLPQCRVRARKNPELRSNCGGRWRQPALFAAKRGVGAMRGAACLVVNTMRSPGLSTGASPFIAGTPTDFPAVAFRPERRPPVRGGRGAAEASLMIFRVACSATQLVSRKPESPTGPVYPDDLAAMIQIDGV